MISGQAIDQAAPVRAGEGLDAGAVARFLKPFDPSLTGLPHVRQFPGGASNLTYLLTYPQREFVLRRAPFGHRPRGAHDMLREAGVMQALKPWYPLVPAVVAVCDTVEPLGSEFYVMERIRGIILRRDPPPGFPLDAAGTRTLCINVIGKLAELHQVDFQSAGLAGLGRGPGYVRRQIEGWSERYLRASTPDTADFTSVMDWLRVRMPPQDSGACVIHNDFRFDNIVLDAERPVEVLGVLDWEMATIGDPLMDLGNSLAYWAQADDEPGFLDLRRQPTHLPGMLSRREVIEHYAKTTDRTMDNMEFYMVYGLFRLAVILAQIYVRYISGDAANEQFAAFAAMTHVLRRRCQATIDAARS